MPCADPRSQWFVGGKWTMAEPLAPRLYRSQQFACGQCAPCRLASARSWSSRLVQEGKVHDLSICATLTYSPECLPQYGTLVRAHVSKFMKALRKVVAARDGGLFSFDCTGEYSPPPFMRPHYHIALFGYVPQDYRIAGMSGAGNQEYVAEELTRVWGKGRVTFQHWSVGAAKYCADHQAWKLTGDKGRNVLVVRDASGVVVFERAREFHACSTRPGIGRRYYERYGAQDLRQGFSVIDKRQVPVPKYYLRRADIDNPELAAYAREQRRVAAMEALGKLEGDYRLDAIEACAEARIERNSRKDGVF